MGFAAGPAGSTPPTARMVIPTTPAVYAIPEVPRTAGAPPRATAYASPMAAAPTAVEATPPTKVVARVISRMRWSSRFSAQRGRSLGAGCDSSVMRRTLQAGLAGCLLPRRDCAIFGQISSARAWATSSAAITASSWIEETAAVGDSAGIGTAQCSVHAGDAGLGRDHAHARLSREVHIVITRCGPGHSGHDVA